MFKKMEQYVQMMEQGDTARRKAGDQAVNCVDWSGGVATQRVVKVTDKKLSETTKLPLTYQQESPVTKEAAGDNL